MMQITFNDIPATLKNGVVSFVNTPLEGTEESLNEEVRTYADTHHQYFPDLNEVALLLLRDMGTVIIRSQTVEAIDPQVLY